MWRRWTDIGTEEPRESTTPSTRGLSHCEGKNKRIKDDSERSMKRINSLHVRRVRTIEFSHKPHSGAMAGGSGSG